MPERATGYGGGGVEIDPGGSSRVDLGSDYPGCPRIARNRLLPVQGVAADLTGLYGRPVIGVSSLPPLRPSAPTQRHYRARSSEALRGSSCWAGPDAPQPSAPPWSAQNSTNRPLNYEPPRTLTAQSAARILPGHPAGITRFSRRAGCPGVPSGEWTQRRQVRPR